MLKYFAIITLFHYLYSNRTLHRPRGVHSVSLLHSTRVRRILKNIPNFTKYWKILPKIVLVKPPHNIAFQLRKPLVSPDIVGIHFFNPFLIPPLYHIINL